MLDQKGSPGEARKPPGADREELRSQTEIAAGMIERLIKVKMQKLKQQKKNACVASGVTTDMPSSQQEGHRGAKQQVTPQKGGSNACTPRPVIGSRCSETDFKLPEPPEVRRLAKSSDLVRQAELALARRAACGTGVVAFETGVVAFETGVVATDRKRIPDETGKAWSETGKIPSETERAPGERGKAPSDTSRAPSEKKKAPSATGRAQSEKGKAPSDTGRAPSESGKALIATGRAPSESGKAPIATDRAPSEGRKAPSATGRAPSEKGKASSDTGRAPSEKGKASSDTGRALSEKGKASSDTGRAPSEKGKAPNDAGRAPSESGKAPIDTSRAPNEGGNALSDTGRAPSESGKVTSATDGAPIESGKAMIDKSKAPNEETFGLRKPIHISVCKISSPKVQVVSPSVRQDSGTAKAAIVTSSQSGTERAAVSSSGVSSTQAGLIRAGNPEIVGISLPEGTVDETSVRTASTAPNRNTATAASSAAVIASTVPVSISTGATVTRSISTQSSALGVSTVSCQEASEASVRHGSVPRSPRLPSHDAAREEDATRDKVVYSRRVTQADGSHKLYKISVKKVMGRRGGGRSPREGADKPRLAGGHASLGLTDHVLADLLKEIPKSQADNITVSRAVPTSCDVTGDCRPAQFVDETTSKTSVSATVSPNTKTRKRKSEEDIAPALLPKLEKKEAASKPPACHWVDKKSKRRHQRLVTLERASTCFKRGSEFINALRDPVMTLHFEDCINCVVKSFDPNSKMVAENFRNFVKGAMKSLNERQCENRSTPFPLAQVGLVGLRLLFSLTECCQWLGAAEVLSIIDDSQIEKVEEITSGMSRTMKRCIEVATYVYFEEISAAIECLIRPDVNWLLPTSDTDVMTPRDLKMRQSLLAQTIDKVCDMVRKKYNKGTPWCLTQLEHAVTILYQLVKTSDTDRAGIVDYKQEELNRRYNELQRLAVTLDNTPSLFRLYDLQFVFPSVHTEPGVLRTIVHYVSASVDSNSEAFENAPKIVTHAQKCGLYPSQRVCLTDNVLVLWSCLTRTEMSILLLNHFIETCKYMRKTAGRGERVTPSQCRLTVIIQERRAENTAFDSMFTKWQPPVETHAAAARQRLCEALRGFVPALQVRAWPEGGPNVTCLLQEYSVLGVMENVWNSRFAVENNAAPPWQQQPLLSELSYKNAAACTGAGVAPSHVPYSGSSPHSRVENFPQHSVPPMPPHAPASVSYQTTSDLPFQTPSHQACTSNLPLTTRPAASPALLPNPASQPRHPPALPGDAGMGQRLPNAPGCKPHSDTHMRDVNLFREPPFFSQVRQMTVEKDHVIVQASMNTPHCNPLPGTKHMDAKYPKNLDSHFHRQTSDITDVSSPCAPTTAGSYDAMSTGSGRRFRDGSSSSESSPTPSRQSYEEQRWRFSRRSAHGRHKHGAGSDGLPLERRSQRADMGLHTSADDVTSPYSTPRSRRSLAMPAQLVTPRRHLQKGFYKGPKTYVAMQNPVAHENRTPNSLVKPTSASSTQTRGPFTTLGGNHDKHRRYVGNQFDYNAQPMCPQFTDAEGGYRGNTHTSPAHVSVQYNSQRNAALSENIPEANSRPRCNDQGENHTSRQPPHCGGSLGHVTRVPTSQHSITPNQRASQCSEFAGVHSQNQVSYTQSPGQCNESSNCLTPSDSYPSADTKGLLTRQQYERVLRVGKTTCERVASLVQNGHPVADIVTCSQQLAHEFCTAHVLLSQHETCTDQVLCEQLLRFVDQNVHRFYAQY